MDFKKKEILNTYPEPVNGVLYVVGTPIGNLGDLSPRAKSVLKQVSAIACEDTRYSGKLIRSLESKAPLFSFHRHNTQSRIPKLLSLLKDGKSLALISDAGLPGISDPGEHLVSAARKEGHEVICIPGPCAATTALISSGLPSERFCFEGFLPIKRKQRKERLEMIASETRTSIIYESPHRLLQLLEELSQACGDSRPLQVARELTKRHEQHIGPTIGSALKYFEEHQPIGELTLVLGGAIRATQKLHDNSTLLAEMKAVIEDGGSANEAARMISKKTGHSKRNLYNLLHKTKNIDGDIF